MTEQIALNEHHRRRLLVSCQYVDQLLTSIERIIAGTSSSPFPRYVQDLTAEERREMRRRIAGLRSQIVAFLKQNSILVPEPAISARHSIITSLGYIDIAVEELKPRYLGGYGLVPPALAPELTTSVEELQRMVKSAIAAMKKSGNPSDNAGTDPSE